MSKPKYQWYGNVVKAIRYYPENKKTKDALQLSSTTANYSGMPKGGGVNRTTESIALRTLSPREEEELEAVETAKRQIESKENGDKILKIVGMVDWNKTHTLEGAGMALFMDRNSAQELRSKFIYTVARNMRYL